MLSLLSPVEESPIYLNDKPIASSATILERIKQQAIRHWGEEKWRLNLVHAYVRIAQTQGDDKATVNNRRSQIAKVFETGNCTLETAIVLAAAVGCKFQLACTKVEVEEF
jgi:hypothetical protein